VRQDGTCAYYFDKEELASLLLSCHGSSDSPQQEAYDIVIEENDYILRQYANRQQHRVRYRVWIHGKYQKITQANQATSHDSWKNS
jgi:hypothetical protein